jgi:hypothetical protein
MNLDEIAAKIQAIETLAEQDQMTALQEVISELEKLVS